MAEKKKETIGFNTSAKRIQEEYEALKERLSQKKTNWEEDLKYLNEKIEKDLMYAEQQVKLAAKNPSLINMLEMQFLILALRHTSTLTSVSRLGIELGECNQRLAGVEKEIKTIRLGK